jgi:DNA-directed RNA polymerase omega subunit
MGYLKLVEDYRKDNALTQFEKVLVAARRAKDLHNGGKVPLVDTEHKPSYAALEELKENIILPVYRAEEATPLPPAAAEEGEDEEE